MSTSPGHPSEQPERRGVHVDGVVQGVGFRPFIYALAARHGLTGWVLNSSSGVDIEVQGPPAALEAFCAAIPHEAPRLARVDRVSVGPLAPLAVEDGFSIRHSEPDDGTSLVSPDVATCSACLAEVFDPANRRYRYPFTNCTDCGPRYTIIHSMPYDRPATTMQGFTMCPACRAEYEDPLDRRFHAQPNACPECGPQAWLEAPSTLLEQAAGEGAGRPDAITQAAALLRQGYIVAVRGLGGFHLACDATSEAAVARLRALKSRPDKPFAVMVASLNDAEAHCLLNNDETALLGSATAPVVLLYRRPESTIAAGVAPANPMLGLMLPPTPLHHLLLHDAGRPLVMTSGNASDLPIIIDNDEAREKLAGVADAFLLHNRPIHMRCDDAVWWVDRFAGEQDAARQPLRRSRGDAPYPVRLPWESPLHVLGTGAEMKNTLCLLRDDSAFLSQHIGEIDSLESFAYYRATLDHLCGLFKVAPTVIAHDLHPGYLTTRLALDLAAERGLRLIGIQHHHAHIAACLAEHGREGPVIGVAFDGTGYGPDGAIWGGEVLVADLQNYERAAHLEYLPLPGGETAIQRPYRIAWGYLLAATGSIPDLPALRGLPSEERRIVERQVERGLNAPLTSSAGRLFDAVAALLGVCTVATFEAQAAIALELAARESVMEGMPPYPFTLDTEGVFRLSDLLNTLCADVSSGQPAAVIATRFHVTAAEMALVGAERVRAARGLNTIALSGGVFQNRLLLRLTRERLRAAGFEVLTHRLVPANDGGLSLGQAVIGQRSTADA